MRGKHKFPTSEDTPVISHSHSKHLSTNCAVCNVFISSFAVAEDCPSRQTPAMPGGNFRDTILEYMRSHATQPMTKSSLARNLQVPVERRSELRKAIEALCAEGVRSPLCPLCPVGLIIRGIWTPVRLAESMQERQDLLFASQPIWFASLDLSS